MSKPSTPKKFTPAGTVIVAAVMLALLGIISVRSLRPSAAMKRVSPSAQASAPQDRARMLSSMASLPLAFEENLGQTDAQVKYMARGNGYTVFLTARDAVMALHSCSHPAKKSAASSHTNQTGADRTAAIRLHLVGGNPHSSISASSQLPGHSNYFIGNDRSRWHAGVPQYARVSYRGAYPGVNMAYYGVQKQLEFDFIVAPGASPNPIRLGVTGANRISTDEQGNLILASSSGNVLLHRPVAYQQSAGVRQPVDARFVLQSHNQVSFELGNYDRSRELVIDPSVTYATYLGGTAEDDGHAIAVDGSGNAWVTGQTKSVDFPTMHPLYSANKGSFDAFVTEFKPDGTLLYSTYIGGAGDDSGNAIAIGPSGGVYVAGGTKSGDFPYKGGYQTRLKGTLNAFVLELTSSGSTLMYSTFLGGGGSDVANGLALDSSGNAFVVGSASSTDFPTMNPLPNETKGGFVTELNSSLSALVYSTFLGAGPTDFASAVAVDASDNAYVTGGTQSSSFFTTSGSYQTTYAGLYDAFVTVIQKDGTGLVYSTFLGGSSNDQGLGIAVDSSQNAYVTGSTSSSNFPLGVSRLQGTLKGTQNAFVSELNSGGSQLLYSTYLGGSGTDSGLAIAVDTTANAYVTGMTGSSDFPMANATQSTYGGQNDAFVSEINSGGSVLLLSTYLGGSGAENTSTSSGTGSLAGIAVDSAGANIYVTGSTSSPTGSFPVSSGAYQAAFQGGSSDAFVVQYANPLPTFPSPTEPCPRPQERPAFPPLRPSPSRQPSQHLTPRSRSHAPLHLQSPRRRRARSATVL